MAATETCMTGCTLASDYVSWVPIVGIVILSVLLLLAIIYMLSRLFNKREWEALAKTELTQTFAAVIWIVIIAAFAAFTCSVACSITKDTNPFTTSLDYLNNLRGILESRINELLVVAKDIRIKTAIMYWLPGVAIKPFDGCAVIANNLESFTAILAPFIGSIMVQQYALSLAQNLAFTVILPIGIILRIIPYAREIGAFLIALAVALYIVLPLTYVFADKAMSTVTLSAKTIESPGQDCVDPGKAKEIFETIGYTLPQAVFFPSLSMIITIAFARSLSKVFMYDFQDITQ
jgi:hypothetical protein